MKRIWINLATILAAMILIISPSQADEEQSSVPSSLKQVQILNNTLEETKKTVIIKIAEEDLMTLKTGEYKLCFAKKVENNDYNVVWQSYEEYLSNNQFSWTPQYQIFGSNTFQEGEQVFESINPKNIRMGGQITLDEFGLFGEPSTGGPDDSITMHNEYGSIHPGLNQLSTGIHGTQESTPIYVAVNSAVKGDIILTPVDKVLVWFEQNVETSTMTMFNSSHSKLIDIDLTNSSSATRKYENQEWIIP